MGEGRLVINLRLSQRGKNDYGSKQNYNIGLNSE